MWDQVGSHHPFPPEPHIRENTHYVDAGCVRIGVEFRELDSARFMAAYEGGPFEELYKEFIREQTELILAKIELAKARGEEPPPFGGRIAGLSIHVFGTDDGHEYLRFDCFNDVPHYHYLRPWTKWEECDNHAIEWDEVAHGPLDLWAIDRVRTRLPEMLTEAGGAHVAARLDQTAIDRAVDEVERLAKELSATNA